MKQKTGISLMLALLMIVSTYAVGAGEVNTCDGGGFEPLCECEPFGEVVKEVYDGEGWVDVYTAELGELVYFKMTLTYHETGDPAAYQAMDIVVVDTLPDCLSYDSCYSYPEAASTDVDEQTITWDFGDLVLIEGESIVILLNATVDAYTDEYGEDNLVEVTALETCSHIDLCQSATATVICEEPQCNEGIEVTKQVSVDGDDWFDSIDDLLREDVLKFRITVTYTDCDEPATILCMKAVDYLPCCLDFVGGVSYEGSTFEVPEDVLDVDGKTIYWNWTGIKTIQMNDGDMLVITFDTNVTSYCEGEQFNEVYVHAWTCPCCDPFYGWASVKVDCTAPETTFDKWVLDTETEEWVKEGFGLVHGEMTFKLELKYYEELDPVGVRFRDEMPCVLEFSELLESTEGLTFGVEHTENKKTVWFNMTEGEVMRGDTVYIIFTADITGPTSGGCCQEDAYNRAWVEVYECEEPTYADDDEVPFETVYNSEPYAPSISGEETEGKGGETFTFCVTGTDPDHDDLYYFVDWGDGTDSGWIGPHPHGTPVKVTHEWEDDGKYEVRAKSKDAWDQESAWGNELEVLISGDAPDDLSVSIKRGLSRGIKVTLKNNKDEDIVDIDWDLLVTKRVLKRKLFDENGTLEELGGGNSTELGDLTKFGFGMITLTVNVSSDDVDPIPDQTVKGFIFGRLVYLRRR